MTAFANVLTGIMGATMTIGLAAAGGSQMAPRYEEAKVTSRAAMAISAVRQTGQAVVMARAVDGSVPNGLEGVKSLVSSGWLNAVPENPTDDQPSGAPVPISHEGSSWVEMRLAGNVGVCDEIARQSGMGREAPEVASLDSDVREGCVMTRSGPVAFVRV